MDEDALLQQALAMSMAVDDAPTNGGGGGAGANGSAPYADEVRPDAGAPAFRAQCTGWSAAYGCQQVFAYARFSPRNATLRSQYVEALVSLRVGPYSRVVQVLALHW